MTIADSENNPPEQKPQQTKPQQAKPQQFRYISEYDEYSGGGVPGKKILELKLREPSSNADRHIIKKNKVEQKEKK